MSWFILIVAGLLEVGWSLGLKTTAGFSRPVPSLLTGLAIVLSMYFLAVAARALPIGTAYPVWVGIGVLGAAVGGALFFGEAISPARAAFLGLLLISIVGLGLTSNAS